MNAAGFKQVLQTMGKMFPEAKCELNYHTPFELLIAVVLSAQCTDQTVNKVTGYLFQKYGNPEDYLKVERNELENDIRRIGLFRNKAAHIQKLCQLLLIRYAGQVPSTFEQLIELPGVGRKTANVVLACAFDIPALAVDTHVQRVSKRLNVAKMTDSVFEVEKKLKRLILKEQWSQAHHTLLFFGRYFCKAQNPKCSVCPFLSSCPEGKRRMKLLN